MRRSWYWLGLAVFLLGFATAAPARAAQEPEPAAHGTGEGHGTASGHGSAGHDGHAQEDQGLFGKALDLGIWTVVVFLVLLWVLSKYAWGPMLQGLQKREQNIQDAGVEVQTFARQGDPADAILDVAEEQNADLIIVGNKGMSGAKRFLLGSVPNKVSHHAPCSVMIIRTT